MYFFHLFFKFYDSKLQSLVDQAWIVVFAGSKELFPDRPVGVLVVPDGLWLHLGAVARLGRRVVPVG